MAFTKGISGNSKGRKPGTPNKTTQLHREFVQTLLDGQQNKIKTELSKLKGKDYITAVTGLLEFAIPKLQRTEMEADVRTHVKQVMIIGGKEIEF